MKFVKMKNYENIHHIILELNIIWISKKIIIGYLLFLLPHKAC